MEPMEVEPHRRTLMEVIDFNSEEMAIEEFLQRGEKELRGEMRGELRECIQAKLEEDILSYELVLSGFNLDNQNLMCVQLANALQAQLEILERAIFKNCPQPLYSFGVGFLPSEYFCGECDRGEIEVKCEGDLQATEYWSIKNKQTTSVESEAEYILRQEWQTVTEAEKSEYLVLRREVDQLKKVINETLSCRPGKEHICLLCGAEFESGRQLGGHMSRRHPGNSLDYSKKRQMHFTKTVERERRKYFKDIKKDPLPRAKPISKHTAP